MRQEVNENIQREINKHPAALKVKMLWICLLRGLTKCWLECLF